MQKNSGYLPSTGLVYGKILPNQLFSLLALRSNLIIMSTNPENVNILVIEFVNQPIFLGESP